MQAGQSINSILATEIQKPNPIMKHIKKARVEFSRFPEPVDFVCGADRVPVIFISSAFHAHDPSVLVRKLQAIESYRTETVGSFRPILLCLHVGGTDTALADIQVRAFRDNLRMLCAFSESEAARILEICQTFSSVRAAEVVRGHAPKGSEALASIKGVNTTDAAALMHRFGSIKAVANATEADLLAVPNIGAKKAKAIWSCFNNPW